MVLVLLLIMLFSLQYFVFDFHMAPVMLFDKIISFTVSQRRSKLTSESQRVRDSTNQQAYIKIYIYLFVFFVCWGGALYLGGNKKQLLSHLRQWDPERIMSVRARNIVSNHAFRVIVLLSWRFLLSTKYKVCSQQNFRKQIQAFLGFRSYKTNMKENYSISKIGDSCSSFYPRLKQANGSSEPWLC